MTSGAKATKGLKLLERYAQNLIEPTFPLVRRQDFFQSIGAESILGKPQNGRSADRPLQFSFAYLLKEQCALKAVWIRIIDKPR